MIVFREVSKKFRCGSSFEQLFSPLEVEVISGLSFEHPVGEPLLITGPSGSGKSVIIDLLAGLYRPDKGVVEVFGKSPATSREVRADIGIVCSQRTELDQFLSPRRNLRLLTAWYNIVGEEAENRVEETLDYVDIEPGARDVPLGELSPGVINLVNIAAGLISSPQLLLLDEPATHLGPTARDKLKQLLKGLNKQGMTLVVASKDDSLVADLSPRSIHLAAGEQVNVNAN